MLNPNQPINSLSIDVFIVEEAPLKYVKTPGFSDDMDSVFDPKSVPDEPPKSSKITFRSDHHKTVCSTYKLKECDKFNNQIEFKSV